MIYDRGVRGWGAFMLITAPLLLAAFVAASAPQRDLSTGLLVLSSVLMGYVAGMPFFLWAGYVMGSLIASNRFPKHREANDLPPPI
jgi:hypothetical protein